MSVTISVSWVERAGCGSYPEQVARLWKKWQEVFVVLS